MPHNLPHTGDVHSPESFGFDMTDPADVSKWYEITGEIPKVMGYTSLQPRGGVDPSDEDFFSQLGETRGD